VTFLCSSPVLMLVWIMFSARLIPCCSAAYTVDVSAVPMNAFLICCLLSQTIAAPVWPPNATPICVDACVILIGG
jgi:hypothetical protein